jgi:hypothetical protein
VCTICAMRLHGSRLLFVSAFSVTSLSALIATSQVKKHSAEPFRNLQVLKPAEVDTQMREYNTGLRVGCEYCHMPADYATDDSANKVIARQMILLTRDINAKYFGGLEQVTCFSCHQGSQKPLNAPQAQ